jgi:hypothetical protein
MKGGTMLAALAIGMIAACLAGCSDPAGKLTSSDPDEVINAIRAVAQRGNQGDVELLVNVVANPDERVAREAVIGIGTIKQPESADALRSITRGERGEKRDGIRTEAMMQVAHQPDEKTAVLLREIVKIDPSPSVRIAAIGGIENLKSFQDLPLLVEVTRKDGDLAVQSRSVKAIERLVHVRFGFDRARSSEERQAAINQMATMVLQLVENRKVSPDGAVEKGK